MNGCMVSWQTFTTLSVFDDSTTETIHYSIDKLPIIVLL
jgi:hypothetical protein